MVDLFIPYSSRAYFYLSCTKRSLYNLGKLAELLKGEPPNVHSEKAIPFSPYATASLELLFQTVLKKYEGTLPIP